MIELPPFDALALSLHHSPGVHAILVGSGLSGAAGIPTGWEITLDLIRRLAALDGVAEHEDWAAWYRDKYGQEPSYSEILNALTSTAAERRAILHGYIEPAEGDDARKPTKAHHAIAQLVVSGAVILRAPSRRYPFYWAARGKVGGLAQDLLDQRGGRSFAIADADSFFVKLAETLEALKQASRPHPQSVEMAVALAKRYCRDDKYAMEWSEFLHAEVEKIAKFVRGPEYPTDSPTNDSLNVLVERFHALTETLRRACLVCGRWGTRDANAAVAQAIRSLCFHHLSQSGFTWLISMRNFPAMMCFYWNAMGLIAGGQWAGLRSLFRAEVVVDSKPTPLITVTPPTAFGSLDWKFLKGLENHHTPVSDYLRQKIEPEIRDIAVLAEGTDDLFDMLEAIISLEFALDRLKRMKGTGLWFWTPPGRYVWKRSRLSGDSALDQFANLGADHPLLTAGLLGGTPAKSAEIVTATREYFATAARSWY